MSKKMKRVLASLSVFFVLFGSIGQTVITTAESISESKVEQSSESKKEEKKKETTSSSKVSDSTTNKESSSNSEKGKEQKTGESSNSNDSPKSEIEEQAKYAVGISNTDKKIMSSVNPVSTMLRSNGNSSGKASKNYGGYETSTAYITIDGQPAICIDPDLPFPINQEYIEQTYNDYGVYTILWYAQEKGFFNNEDDYVDTFVAMNWYLGVETSAAKQADPDVAFLYNKGKNPDAPKGSFDLSNKVQTADFNTTSKLQETKWLEPKLDSNSTGIEYTITVPSGGVKAVTSDGETFGVGTHKIKQNIKVKYTAPANYTGDVTFDVPTNLKVQTPLIFMPTNSNVQRLVSMGYLADPITVKGVKLTFFARLGDAKVTKLDKGTGKVVPNTEFLFEYDGKKETVKTNEKGEATVKDILHGTKVTVTETFVPAPYILDTNNTKEITIEAGKVTSVEFKNERATGKTTLTKQDATTESNEPLNSAYPMTGAKYGLFKEDGTLLKEFTLDEKLTATMDKLELGNYYWQETVAPTGYVLDQEKHVIELTYKDQYTPVVIKETTSNDDVIRMNIDGQKLIQNETNEMFKNGVEFTLTNKRTGETQVVTTSTVDSKKGYFQFADLALDDYVLTETKGVEGYKSVDPIEITHSYDKETDTFTFVIKDQKSGNVLNEENFTQLELSKGENVDLGTYTLKDKAEKVLEPKVTIRTKAHTGDGKTGTFTWGDDVTLYDDVFITHEDILDGTERAFETILVAVYADGKEKDVWTSGKIDYKVSDKEMTERVKADYDYKKDPKGTRYYFRELGYSKTDGDYKEDTDHNKDGKDKEQDITPKVKKTPETPKKEEKKTEKQKEVLPQTGEMTTGNKIMFVLGLVVLEIAVLLLAKKRKSKVEPHED